MRHRPPLLICAALTLLGSVPSAAWGLGQEGFGNDPVNEANYKQWPGVIDVINHRSRVYHWWVNGNEKFFYRGDAKALSEVLKAFAESGGRVHEVILRPGPGQTTSFDRTKTVAFDWQLHLVGGIAGHMLRQDKGELVWPARPTMTVHVSERIPLDKLVIPDGVTLVELKDLKKRYAKALKSTHQSVRGWTAGKLAQLDPYDNDSVKAVAGILKDSSAWVRLNAVMALPEFGERAKAILPTLRKMAETADERMKKQIETAVQTITNAKAAPAAARQHAKALETISKFVKKRQASK